MSMAGPGRKLLLIDEDPVLLRSYGQRLRADGWDVVTAEDGHQAAAAALGGPWDLILLGLRIPLRGAVDVVRTLRQRNDTATTPLWVLSQTGDGDMVERALREGADGVLDKTKLAPRDIAAEVERVLEARRRPGPAKPRVVESAVPAEVDEIARRLRNPDGTGATPSDSEAAAEAATSRLSSQRSGNTTASMHGNVTMSIPRTPAPPSVGPGATAGGSGWSAGPNVRRSGVAKLGATEAVGTARIIRRPDRPATAIAAAAVAGAEQARVDVKPDDITTSFRVGIPIGSSRRPVVPASAAISTFSSPAAAAASAAFDAAMSQPAPAFDVMLNRLVGQAAGLAGSLGLPTDFLCPVCSAQLVLRLSPDPTNENGVRGYFYCTRCTGPR